MATRYWPIVLIAAVPLFLYICFILLCSSHFIQRQFQYAHLFHTQWWHDTNEPEYWGFASPIRREQENQVTPFFLTTPDNERIYAWHVLPLPLYTRHEEELADQPTGVSKNVAQTLNFKLLKGDPNAKLVISLHGVRASAQSLRNLFFHGQIENMDSY
ncbi:hypothetical protein VTK73DRAFT_2341 [Phialemonium thermophilum]|uniref:Uncharacterized protein n=1 Tax=Phialemonium thermophilum TaxID=223376 RepID=A0ABR3VS93_9PEZI